MHDDDDDRPVLRDVTGRFQPGTRPLSTGRPPLPHDVRDALEAGSLRAAERLVDLVSSEDPRIALAASEALLSRLYGRPAQTVNADVRTTDVGVLHLKVLEEIRERRAARLAQEAITRG